MAKSDVFTPDDISKLMAEKLLQYKGKSLLEPSVGKGDLLKNIDIGTFDKVDVFDINKNYLDFISLPVNKYNVDFIETDILCKYDNIIMNPPYIKTQELNETTLTFIRDNFKQLKKGNIDIYYAFIIKCINLLTDDGCLVSITPNSFLKTKSAYELRRYIIDNRYISEIINYNKNIFKGVSVFCCITIFTKKPKKYFKYNNTVINYSDVNDYNIYNLFNNSGCKTLTDICTIRNGIATLSDKVFIHDKKLFDEPCWKCITTGKKDKYIIFPYTTDGKPIEEEIFKQTNINTYNYLLQFKDILKNRDKGKVVYNPWFSFGRTQSLKLPTNKSIYLPTFISKDKIEFTIKEPILYKSCLCIEPKDEKYLSLIVKSINNSKNFIIEQSNHKSGGWINISSRLIYQIPVIDA